MVGYSKPTRPARGESGYMLIEAVVAVLVVGMVGLSVTTMLRQQAHQEIRVADRNIAGALIDYLGEPASQHDCALMEYTVDVGGTGTPTACSGATAACVLPDPSPTCATDALLCDPARQTTAHNLDREKFGCWTLEPWRWEVEDRWVPQYRLDNSGDLANCGDHIYAAAPSSERIITIERDGEVVATGAVGGPPVGGNLAWAVWPVNRGVDRTYVSSRPSVAMRHVDTSTDPPTQGEVIGRATVYNPPGRGGVCAVLVSEPGLVYPPYRNDWAVPPSGKKSCHDTAYAKGGEAQGIVALTAGQIRVSGSDGSALRLVNDCAAPRR